MNYVFVWKTVNVESGEIEIFYEQTIYGEDLACAVKTFTDMHGGLEKDIHGYSLEITSIKLEKR